VGFSIGIKVLINEGYYGVVVLGNGLNGGPATKGYFVSSTFVFCVGLFLLELGTAVMA
jgi:hypothetical protein